MAETRRFCEAGKLMVMVTVSRVEETIRSAAKAPVETAGEAAEAVGVAGRTVTRILIDGSRDAVGMVARTVGDLGRSISHLDLR